MALELYLVSSHISALFLLSVCAERLGFCDGRGDAGQFQVVLGGHVGEGVVGVLPLSGLLFVHPVHELCEVFLMVPFRSQVSGLQFLDFDLGSELFLGVDLGFVDCVHEVGVVAPTLLLGVLVEVGLLVAV